MPGRAEAGGPGESAGCAEAGHAARVLWRGSCGTTGASGSAEKASDCSSQCRSSGRRAMKVPTYGTGSLMPSTVGPFGSAVGSDSVPKSQTNPAWDLLVDLDAVAAGPLHERLKRALRTAIRSGRIPVGATLPPSRVLAGELGCSRWAVTEAYAQLTAEGYLAARTGSGTRVRWAGPAAEAAPPGRRAHPGGLAWTWLPGCRTSAAFPAPRGATRCGRPPSTPAVADLGFAEPAGHHQLRGVLVEYLQRSRAASPAGAQLTVTTSTSSSVRRLCLALAAQGHRTIAVENPGWTPLATAAREAGLEPVLVDVDAEGLRVPDLRRPARRPGRPGGAGPPVPAGRGAVAGTAHRPAALGRRRRRAGARGRLRRRVPLRPAARCRRFRAWRHDGSRCSGRCRRPCRPPCDSAGCCCRSSGRQRCTTRSRTRRCRRRWTSWPSRRCSTPGPTTGTCGCAPDVPHPPRPAPRAARPACARRHGVRRRRGPAPAAAPARRRTGRPRGAGRRGRELHVVDADQYRHGTPGPPGAGPRLRQHSQRADPGGGVRPGGSGGEPATVTPRRHCIRGSCVGSAYMGGQPWSMASCLSS